MAQSAPREYAELCAHVEGERVEGRTHLFLEMSGAACVMAAGIFDRVEASRVRVVGLLREREVRRTEG